MSDDKKTIQFNSSLMSSGSNKTRKNRKPKKEKPKQVIKPNQLKKDLLEKIKKHQQNEKIQNNPTENKTGGGKDGSFHNDFMDSLEYLNKLSSKEKANKKKRKNKTIKNPIHTGGTIPNVSFNEPPLVSVDLPHDFDIKPVNDTLIHLNDMFSNSDQQSNNTLPVIPLQQTSDTSIGNINITSPNNIINPDAPYGCLKGGSKPTYRQFHNKTLKNTSNKFNATTNGSGKLPRHKQLHKLQKSYKKIKQKSVKTKKYTYNLGKKNNNISILIKNNKTRRNVKKEHGLLKQKPLQEIKKYLYECNYNQKKTLGFSNIFDINNNSNIVCMY